MTTVELKSNNVPDAPELVIPPGSRGSDRLFREAVEKWSREMALFLNQYLKEHADDLRKLGSTTF